MRAWEKALLELGKGDLIDNLPSKEGENEGGLFSHSLPLRENRGLCKTRNHVVVVVNEGQTDHCTGSFKGSSCAPCSEDLDEGGFNQLRYCDTNPSKYDPV